MDYSMLSYPEKNDFVEAGNWKTNQKERNERKLRLPKSFTVIIRHLSTLLIKPNFRPYKWIKPIQIRWDTYQQGLLASCKAAGRSEDDKGSDLVLGWMTAECRNKFQVLKCSHSSRKGNTRDGKNAPRPRDAPLDKYDARKRSTVRWSPSGKECYSENRQGQDILHCATDCALLTKWKGVFEDTTANATKTLQNGVGLQSLHFIP